MFEKDYRWTLQRRYGLQISITSIQRSFAISTLAGRDWLLETMALILSLSLHALTLDRPVKHQWDCLDTVLCYYQEMCTNNTCYTFGMVSNLASPVCLRSSPLSPSTTINRQVSEQKTMRFLQHTCMIHCTSTCRPSNKATFAFYIFTKYKINKINIIIL